MYKVKNYELTKNEQIKLQLTFFPDICMEFNWSDSYNGMVFCVSSNYSPDCAAKWKTESKKGYRM